MNKNNYSKIVLSLLLFFTSTLLMGHKLDMDKLGGLKFRSIGPAGMSGRVTAIEVLDNDPSQIFVGSASGGLWKSENGGINFKPIFEGQKVHSIGDVTVYQKNPSILYVGTGEGNPRNSQSSGNGVYKSIDGGVTWEHLGLDNTRNIHRVIIDPNNPDVVYIGAIGTAWSPTADRGVYKTTDGGKTWNKILFVNNSTGVADMVMDPSNPNKIIVAMWEYQRWPWFMNSGGPGSGLYMTIDGGKNWVKKDEKNGLPKGELGRIGIAIAKSNPDVVYALIESKATALYRSNDGGNNWKMTADKNVGDRPFYYADLRVDPTNENRVYNVFTNVTVSEDGGKNFTDLMGPFGVHSDHHAFWINPKNPNHILDGNDGGLYASMDRGKSWRFHHNLPVGQFYHINVDNEIPYNVMGGLQDNGTWSGPAYKWQIFGRIQNTDFVSVGFGDGFDVLPDLDDSRYGYSLSQGGSFMRYDKKTGMIKSIKPQIEGDTKLRFNWNTAIAQDPFDNSTLYIGSQFVHKSTNKGLGWATISPDLTTNDPAKQKQGESGGLTIDNSTAENFTTILVIEPSPLEKGVIWVGTDDGNVQLTKDGGATWTNLVANIKGVPAGTWVPQIKASLHNKGEAFVVFDDHRRNNWIPYVFKTTNYGKTWTRLVDENSVWGYALSIAQDPKTPNLLFLGTEFGLYVSIDAGATWTKWKSDFPTASTMDMIIHPREHDLAVATFGRSLYILDDIRPLRDIAMDKSVMNKMVHLFTIPDAYQAVIGMPSFFGADDGFSGENRPTGALISYWSKNKVGKDSVTINIKDSAGKIFRSLKASAQPGVNRMAWDLKKEASRYPGAMDPFAAFFSQGVEALAGMYTVTVTVGKDSVTQTLKILADPGMQITMDQFKTNLERKETFMKMITTFREDYESIKKMEASLTKLTTFLKDRKDDTSKDLIKGATELQKRVDEIATLGVPKPASGILGDTDDLKAQLQSLGFYFLSPMVPPGESEMILLKKLETKVSDYSKTIADFKAKELTPFSDKVKRTQISLWED